MVIASTSPGCAPADTVQSAVSLNHLGLPQALLCRAVPCPELVCPRYCLSWLNFMRFLSYHSFSLSPWVAALPLTILALPLICCHPQTWWKGILSPPLGIPADVKQVMSQERSIQYSTSYWPPERVQPFNCWPLSPVIQFFTHVVVHLSSPQCVNLDTREQMVPKALHKSR